MKLFYKNFLVWIAFAIIILLLIEIAVRQIPNNYSYKYDYVKHHGSEIKVIAIGHSQLFDGFWPKYFKETSFNLANGGQHYIENYYILKEILQYMPRLEYCIMPIGYMNVCGKDGDTTFHKKSIYYHEYMNINYGGQLPFRYYYECMSPNRALKTIYNYYVRHDSIVFCDSTGFHLLKRENHNLQDRNLYNYTVNPNEKIFRIKYEVYLEKTYELLHSREVKLVLVSPPYYWNGFLHCNNSQKVYCEEYIKRFRKRHDVIYINMEDGKQFEEQDFANSTHLTESGAQKFTKMLYNSLYENSKK